MLQARQNGSRSTFIQSAKLLKETGEPLRALQELENTMRFLGLLSDNHLDLTENEDETRTLKAKVRTLALSNSGADVWLGPCTPLALDG